MHWLQTAAAAGLVLGAASVGQGQQASAPPAQSRPAIIYITPQPGAEQVGLRGSSYMSGGIAPYIIVPTDQIAQQYSCVIRIDSASDIVTTFGSSWLDSQAAVAMLTSSALIDPAVHQELKLSSAKRWENVVVNVTTAGPRLARVEVILRKSQALHYPDDGAQKIVTALIDRLKRAYEASNAAADRANQARVKPITDELTAASARLDAVHRKEREIRARTSEVQANGAFSNQIGNLLSNLRSRRSVVQSELMRNQSRLTAMLPPVTASSQWERLVKARQKEVDELHARAKAHQATDEQVQDAESKLADAQAQLAQINQPQVNDTSSQYRESQLTSLKANVADEQAQLKTIDDQIAKASDPKLMEDLDTLPDLQSQEYPLRNKIAELQMRLETVQRLSHDDPPVLVTVLDGSTP